MSKEAMRAIVDQQVTISLELLDTIYRTLSYYGSVTTYQAPRIGGVLAGCPRGEKPTPEQLIREARTVVEMLDAWNASRLAATGDDAALSLLRAELEAGGEPTLPADAIAANLVRFADLDKHKARICEVIVRHVLAASPVAADTQGDAK